MLPTKGPNRAYGVFLLFIAVFLLASSNRHSKSGGGFGYSAVVRAAAADSNTTAQTEDAEPKRTIELVEYQGPGTVECKPDENNVVQLCDPLPCSTFMKVRGYVTEIPCKCDYAIQCPPSCVFTPSPDGQELNPQCPQNFTHPGNIEIIVRPDEQTLTTAIAVAVVIGILLGLLLIWVSYRNFGA